MVPQKSKTHKTLFDSPRPHCQIVVHKRKVKLTSTSIKTKSVSTGTNGSRSVVRTRSRDRSPTVPAAHSVVHMVHTRSKTRVGRLLVNKPVALKPEVPNHVFSSKVPRRSGPCAPKSTSMHNVNAPRTDALSGVTKHSSVRRRASATEPADAVSPSPIAPMPIVATATEPATSKSGVRARRYPPVACMTPVAPIPLGVHRITSSARKTVSSISTAIIPSSMPGGGGIRCPSPSATQPAAVTASLPPAPPSLDTSDIAAARAMMCLRRRQRRVPWRGRGRKRKRPHRYRTRNPCSSRARARLCLRVAYSFFCFVLIILTEKYNTLQLVIKITLGMRGDSICNKSLQKLPANNFLFSEATLSFMFSSYMKFLSECTFVYLCAESMARVRVHNHALHTSRSSFCQTACKTLL